jgi:hypothetical protein
MKELECEICGSPMPFAKKWTMEGRKNPKTGKGTKLEISFYRCKEGHIKRVANKL